MDTVFGFGWVDAVKLMMAGGVLSYRVLRNDQLRGAPKVKSPGCPHRAQLRARKGERTHDTAIIRRAATQTSGFG
jgi:hypothetical protein